MSTNEKYDDRPSRGLTLRLDIDTLASLTALKAKTGKTKSRIVNEALRMWISDYKKRHRLDTNGGK
jgi:predicted DNA-binding protein